MCVNTISELSVGESSHTWTRSISRWGSGNVSAMCTVNWLYNTFLVSFFLLFQYYAIGYVFVHSVSLTVDICIGWIGNVIWTRNTLLKKKWCVWCSLSRHSVWSMALLTAWMYLISLCLGSWSGILCSNGSKCPSFPQKHTQRAYLRHSWFCGAISWLFGEMGEQWHLLAEYCT